MIIAYIFTFYSVQTKCKTTHAEIYTDSFYLKQIGIKLVPSWSQHNQLIRLSKDLMEETSKNGYKELRGWMGLGEEGGSLIP